jgi:chromosome segregation ATPase
LTGLFYTILGSKDEQLEKERQEYLAAKLKKDECKDSVAALESEIVHLQQKIAPLKNLDAKYESILNRKAQLISEAKDEKAGKLVELSEALADAQSDARELQEAIDAGNAVLDSLSWMCRHH